MPAALNRPTLDELYKRLRDLNCIQVDERMAVTLNAILQLEEQGEFRESATEESRALLQLNAILQLEEQGEFRVMYTGTILVDGFTVIGLTIKS